MPTDMDFPRPHSVMVAERRAFIVTLDDPTYREALDIVWGGALGAQTLAQLVATAADAQRAFHAAQDTRDAAKMREAWRAMRGAELVIAFRANRRLGGPIYA